MQIARDPVGCASNGDVFCRECAVSNLLAQRKEIKRLEKENVRRQREEEEGERARGEEEKERSVVEFEKVMMGMEGARKKILKHPTMDEAGETEGRIGRGVKRKFELNENEMQKNAKVERAKARQTLDEEKVSSFASTKSTKLIDTCEMSVLQTDSSIFLGSISDPFDHKSYPETD